MRTNYSIEEGQLKNVDNCVVHGSPCFCSWTGCASHINMNYWSSTVLATGVWMAAIRMGGLSSCFYATISVSMPVSKQHKLSAPSISTLQFPIRIPCAECCMMMSGALCTTIITITLSIFSTGVSTECLSSDDLSATDSVRTTVAGTVLWIKLFRVRNLEIDWNMYELTALLLPTDPQDVDVRSSLWRVCYHMALG